MSEAVDFSDAAGVQARSDWRSDYLANLPEIVDEICERLADGVPLAEICRSPGMPSAVTVSTWQARDEAVAVAIARARDLGHDAIADRARQTARGQGDSKNDVQRDKLIVETDLRLLAKWNPKKYGDSTQLRHADANGEKLNTQPLVSELLNLMGGTPAQTIESTARDVTPAKPSAFGKPLIPQAPAARPAYRPRRRDDVDDLV